MTRRDFLRLMLAASASFTVLGAGGMANSPSKSSRAAVRKPAPVRAGAFKVAVVAPSHCAASLVLTEVSGGFERSGLDIELVPYAEHMDAAMALRDGEVQAAQLAAPMFFALHQGTGPFKDNRVPLVSLQCAGTGGGALLISSRLDMASPAKLRGHRIATPGSHMTQTLLLYETLKRSGLDPSKDVELKSMGAAEAISSTLRGETDACMAIEPYATPSAMHAMNTSERLWRGHPCCYIAVRRETFLGAEASKVEGFYAATLQGASALREAGAPRDEAMEQLLGAQIKLPVEALKTALEAGSIGYDPYPYKSAGRALLKLMKANGIMDGPANGPKIAPDTLPADRTRMMMASLGLLNVPKSDERRETIAGIIFE